MIKGKRILSFCFGVFLAATFSVVARASFAAASDLLFIVSKSNPVGTLNKGDVKRYLQRKALAWPNGDSVTVVLPGEDSSDFRSIVSSVIGINMSEWHEYWAGQQFNYGLHPPLTSENPLFIIRKVIKDHETIGVVSDEVLKADAREKVKIVYRVQR